LITNYNNNEPLELTAQNIVLASSNGGSFSQSGSNFTISNYGTTNINANYFNLTTSNIGYVTTLNGLTYSGSNGDLNVTQTGSILMQAAPTAGGTMILRSLGAATMAISTASNDMNITSGKDLNITTTSNININSLSNPQYHSGGSDGLLDGIFGNTNWRKGDWQGYQGQDFEAVIDMQKETIFHSIDATFLQDSRSWILMPTKVEYFTSTDNIQFTLVATIDNDINPKQEENSIKDFSYNTKPINARYLKVKAYNFGKLPEWHQGAGGDAFIFIDEITIK
jgi:hypothetical protein